MEENKEMKRPKKRVKVFRIFMMVLLFIILFPLFISLLLQWRPVQNFVVDQTTSYLGKKFDGEIIIDEVDFSPRYGLDLNNFVLIDDHRDTIIYSRKFIVNLGSSLLSLKDNVLDINSVQLIDPTVRIVKPKGSKKSNLELVLDKLLRKNTTENSGEPIELTINDIKLHNLDMLVIDESKGMKDIIKVGEGHIMFDKFMKDDELSLSLLRLRDPVVELVRRKVDGSESITVDDQTVAEVDQISSDNPLDISIDLIDIRGGIFSLQDHTKPHSTTPTSIDYNYMTLQDISVQGGQFVLEDLKDIMVNVNQISFKDDKGFQVKDLKSNNVHIGEQEIDIPSLYLATNQSILRDRVKFNFKDYDSFKNFANEVEILASFSNSRLALADLLHFVPSLYKEQLFRKNKNATVLMKGLFQGNINQLSGKNIALQLNDNFFISGNLNSKNLARKGQEFLGIEIDSLRSDMNSLKEIVPDFNPPENFMNLGTVDFKGTFQGMLRDFTANGKLKTDLGYARMNMKLNASHEISEALYSGDLSLTQFDLKRWSGNDDFGVLDMKASVENGIGLTANTARVDIKATINEFEYKNHPYTDVELDGRIDKNLFDGVLQIDNPDVSLNFDGTVEIENEIPYLAFDAEVKRLDLYKMNLSKDPLQIEGDFIVDLEGKHIDDVSGRFTADNVDLFYKDTLYSLEHLETDIDQNDIHNKNLMISSELFEIIASGDYQLRSLVPSVRHLIKNDYPVFLKNWPENTVDTSYQDISIDMIVHDSKNFLELAGVKDLRLQNVAIGGHLNTRDKSIDVAGELPVLRIANNNFFNTSFSFLNKDKQGNLEMIIDSSSVNGWVFNPIKITSEVVDEDLKFHVETDKIIDSLQQVSLLFELTPEEGGGYKVKFDKDRLTLLGKEWNFHPLNNLIVRDDAIIADHLIISDGLRSIMLNDLNEHKGVNLTLEDFDLDLINAIIKEEKTRFTGIGDLNLSISDIYSKSFDLFGDVTVDDFRINDDPYGSLKLRIVKPQDKNVDVNFLVGDESFKFDLNGNYNPKTKMVDATVETHRFPLKIFEFIILNGIENTYGGIDLDAKITGPLKTMKIDGVGKVMEAGTQILYTGVPYHFDDQSFTVTENRIDLTGARIYDENENYGVITGGLIHEYFKDFELDVNISGDDVIALNTTKKQNPIYYGFAKGSVDVDFSGPFHLVNMKFVCETKKGSVLNIPIASSSGNIDESFITFIEKEDLNNPDSSGIADFKLEGIDIEMDLSMTPDAQVNLIFDESRGDVIQGRGRGNMKIYITRFGDFDIYGNYSITSGEYLFTAFGLVAKPFQVEPGGLIRWTGDPINATLDIKANYSVRTPLNIFLNEYIANPRIAGIASNKTQVDLQLKLKNKLFNPTVNFGLEFPDVNGELRSLVDSKMRTLSNNQNEINNQVLGLIVFNSFLPSSSIKSVGGNDVTTAGISTLSEFVSSQLSIMLTGLINEALTEDGLVSGVDFNIGLKKNTFYGVSAENNNILPDEIEVHLNNKFRFLDERLSLNVGGNYVRAPIRNIQEYFIGDFVLEYYLTEERKLKLRVYGKYDYDEAVADRKLKYGLGLGYRTEFGKLTEFQDQFKNDLKNIIDSTNP